MWSSARCYHRKLIVYWRFFSFSSPRSITTTSKIIRKNDDDNLLRGKKKLMDIFFVDFGHKEIYSNLCIYSSMRETLLCSHSTDFFSSLTSECQSTKKLKTDRLICVLWLKKHWNIWWILNVCVLIMKWLKKIFFLINFNSNFLIVKSVFVKFFLKAMKKPPKESQLSIIMIIIVF